MDIQEKIQDHLKAELGGAYKELAAAEERDSAAQTSDFVLFLILLFSTTFAGLLIFTRLLLNAKSKKELSVTPTAITAATSSKDGSGFRKRRRLR